MQPYFTSFLIFSILVLFFGVLCKVLVFMFFLYFPTQNFEKTLSTIDSSTSSPVMSARRLSAPFKSINMQSMVVLSYTAIALSKNSIAFVLQICGVHESMYLLKLCF